MLTRYDAVAVLCGGLRCDGETYHPASFTDSDEHGMLGSQIRVLAAADLYRAGCAGVFLFSTGVSQKSRARFGPAVPPRRWSMRSISVPRQARARKSCWRPGR